MKKVRCAYGGLVATLILAAMFSIPVLAKESVFTTEESGQSGRIMIRLEDTSDNLPKENVQITVAKIAESRNGKFLLYDEYANTEIDLNNIQNANELKSAATKLEETAPEGEKVITNSNGIASISNLSSGVYLVYASDVAGYEKITPALVSIPMWDEVENSMVYDVEILPKHTPLPEEGEADVPLTGMQDHTMMYLLSALGALMIVGSCLAVKQKEKGRTLQKK